MTVWDGTTPLQGVVVDFEIVSGPNAGATYQGTTDENGEVAYIYTGSGGIGVDTIQASGTRQGISFGCTANKTWIQPQSSFSPSSATNPINASHTITVTVTDGTVPLAGVVVDFNVQSGPNEDESSQAMTDTSGIATFTYTGDGGVGTDSIQASGTYLGIPFQGSAHTTWVQTECSLSPLTSSGELEASHTITVTVTDGNGPIVGEVVDFNVLSGPNVGDSGQGTTDVNGEATFTYTGDGGAGTDSIEASGTHDGIAFSCTASRDWYQPQCSLTPLTSSGELDTIHTITVTVTDGAGPLAGEIVDFNVLSGPNAGDSGQGTTDVNGEATFMYAGDGGAGTDVIEASGTHDGIAFSCTASRGWYQPQCSLFPLTSSGSVNTSHTITVMVTDGTGSLAGEVVDFNILSGPNVGDSGQRTTDVNGEATFSYTGDGGAGTDVIEASGTHDGIPFNCSASKEWSDIGCALVSIEDGIQQLKVSANGRFLVRQDNTPFSWIGDTAWKIVMKLDQAAVNSYLAQRSNQGFTTIQLVGLTELKDPQVLNEPNVNGDSPFLNSSIQFGDILIPNEPYWAHVDYIINKAEETGLYVALLPCWAQEYIKLAYWSSVPNNIIFNDVNAKAYGEFIGDRYKDKSNIIWVMGGDTSPIDSTGDAISVIRAMAEGVAKGVAGGDPSWNVPSPAWNSLIMTYHPTIGEGGFVPKFSSSFWFQSDAWLDFNMIQTGHSILRPQTYEPIENDYGLSPIKPTLIGEARYEGARMRHKPVVEFWADLDTRKSAYWSVFAGGFGYTYGHNSVFQFFMPGDPPITNPIFYTDALNAPGAEDMKHVRSLIESRSALNRIPAQSIILSNPGTEESRIQATTATDGSYAWVYIPDQQTSVTIDMASLFGPDVTSRWFNPREGTYQPIGTFSASGSQVFTTPSSGPDWVLVLDSTGSGGGGSSSGGSSQPGSNHTVKVTVTNGGNPVQGALVNFNVISGPNAGDSGQGTTDANGEATFTYPGDGGVGTDTVQASGTHLGGSFTCSVTKLWVDPQCNLTPSNATNLVNTSHTTTATVTNGGTPTQGVPVDFSILNGPNAGDSGQGTTDVNGRATFVYPGDGGVGPDLIQASGSIGGVPFSCTANKLWVQPQCNLTPTSGSNPPHTQHTVTVLVTDGIGGAVQGVVVDFDVVSGPNAGDNGQGVTDSNGEASFSYTGDNGLGTDLVEASGSTLGAAFSCLAQHTWSDVPVLSRVTDCLVALYTFDEGSGNTVHDTSGFGAPLDLTIASPGNVTWGTASLTINSGTTISSGVNATKVIDEIKAKNGVSFEVWLQPSVASQSGAPRIMTISANDTTRNATLVHNGLKLQSRIRNTGTDLKGQPYFSTSSLFSADLIHLVVTRTSAGHERVYVNTLVKSARQVAGSLSNWSPFPMAIASEASGGRHWQGTMELAAVYCKALSEAEVQQNFDAGPDGNIPPPGPVPQCTLTPASSSIIENNSHAVTSTVTLDGQPVSGVLVNFLVDSGPNGGKTGTGTTGANGQATFTYIGDQGVGLDRIKASGTHQSESFECNAEVDWLAQPVPQCTLVPLTGVRLLNDQHAVTVLVSTDGTPLQGITVDFNVLSGPNAGTNGQGVTDASGQTTFAYTGDGGLGTDLIQASGVAGTSFSCNADVLWVAPQCTLTPPNATHPLNSQHSVTILVTDGLSPVQGVLVDFEVLSGPNAGKIGQDTTDANGEAIFAYTGDSGVGSDTIRASGAYVGGAFTCTAQANWTDVSCLLAPSSGTSLLGSSHTVTVAVTDAGIPQAGVFVDFDVLSGPNVGKTGQGTTDANGEAIFTYIGDGGVGTDSILASGLAGGEAFNCSSDHTWVDPLCTLAPGASIGDVGSIHTVTVTLTDGVNPVSGVLVNFDVLSGPKAGETGQGTTDNGGQATFTYSGDNGNGTDVIEASGFAFGTLFSCQAQQQWVEPPENQRVTDCLVALYAFDEGSGNTVHDTSGFGGPLDLTIANPENVTWGTASLSINSGTTISSGGNATKVINEIKAKNGVSFEVWLQPSVASQSGAPRIMTISANDTTRNASVVHNSLKLQSRIRNTGTDLKGRPYANTGASSQPVLSIWLLREIVQATSEYT